MGKKIKVCPVCGSTRIFYYMGEMTGAKYQCNDCGYVGSLILEIDEDEYENWLKAMHNSEGDENANFAGSS